MAAAPDAPLGRDPRQRSASYVQVDAPAPPRAGSQSYAQAPERSPAADPWGEHPAQSAPLHTLDDPDMGPGPGRGSAREPSQEPRQDPRAHAASGTMLPTDFDLDAAARADAGDSIERVGPPSSPRAADSSQASMPATRPAAGRSAARSVASAFLGDFDDDEYDDDDAGASMSMMEGAIRGSIPYKLIAIAVSLGVVAFVLGFWWFVLREPAETCLLYTSPSPRD